MKTRMGFKWWTTASQAILWSAMEWVERPEARSPAASPSKPCCRALGLDPLTAESMQRAVSAANSSVYSKAERDLRLAGMGTTLVALATRGQHAWIAHVGDSRCYRLREGRLECLTQDHSLVDEQVRLGQMTRAQAAISPMRNVITRAVGTTAACASRHLRDRRSRRRPVSARFRRADAGGLRCHRLLKSCSGSGDLGESFAPR